MQESRKSSQGTVIKQRLGSFSRDTHDNLGSKGTKAPTQVKDGHFLTLATSIN